MIVLDTNVIVPLFIRTAESALVRSALARDRRHALPPLWRSEFLNVAVRYVRAGVWSQPQALRAVHEARRRFAPLEVEPADRSVVDAALEFGVSAYDAQFVAVARAVQGVVITFDSSHFAAKCPANLVKLVPDYLATA